ncbi:MAG: DUF507 family protein [Acidobacteria bacterium]|jgi:hypothetical protein|nr:DUF507 family protein [Acidobacteriota bacterium]
MKLSHEKVIQLSHLLSEALDQAPGVSLVAEKNDVRLAIVRLLKRELQMEADIERKVTTKIESLRRGVPEGSPEWDILYRKYYDEEVGKYRSIKE